MTFDEFKAKWINKYCDFDGFYGYQCMDLYQQYNREVIGAPHVPADPAYKVFTNNQYPKDFYNKVVNTPLNIPDKGDIPIWGPMPLNPGGHIGVFDSGNVNEFISFDQNWPPGSPCHLQKHNYSYVLGWLHPKQTPNDKLISSTTLLTILNGPGSDGDKLIKIRSLV